MKKPIYFILILQFTTITFAKSQVKNVDYFNLASNTLNRVYQLYSCSYDTLLLNETYPFNPKNVVNYILNQDEIKKQRVAYLWPTSGMFSGVAAMLQVSGDSKYKRILESRLLPGLNHYFDSKRKPNAYQSYVNSEARSDRFYDDNIWLVIDFADLYLYTKDQYYLKQAELVWKFVISGWDNKLNGGIYWCEQKKNTKNTCSNAPAVVASAKLYEATKDVKYLKWSEKIYNWTKLNLQDKSDFLYYDNIRLNNNEINKHKFAYNSGQMIQGAALLFKLTKNKMYYDDAKNIATNAFSHFTKQVTKDNIVYPVFERGNGWFSTVMSRGYFELYSIDKDARYIEMYKSTLNYIQKYARYSNGLFYGDWAGIKTEKYNNLLDQACIIELAARLSIY